MNAAVAACAIAERPYPAPSRRRAAPVPRAATRRGGHVGGLASTLSPWGVQSLRLGMRLVVPLDLARDVQDDIVAHVLDRDLRGVVATRLTSVGRHPFRGRAGGPVVGARARTAVGVETGDRLALADA